MTKGVRALTERWDKVSLSDWLEVAGLAVASLALLLSMGGSTFGKSSKLFLFLLEVGVSIWGIIVLGSVGFAIIGGAILLSFLVHTIRFNFIIDRVLRYAATQAVVSRKEMGALHIKLFRSRETKKQFRKLRALGTAQLISELAQRNRSTEEIEAIAPPISLMWSVHDTDLAILVDKFDRILRLYGEPADEAMRIADIITVSVQKSAANFDEMLDAYIAVMDPAA